MPPQSTRWCWTLNNPSAGDEQLIADLGVSEHVRYLVYGRETGESGTPHLQGFVLFSDRKRLRGVKALLGTRIHAEVARGTNSQASDYCKKDGDYVEHGELPSNQGKRNDWVLLRDWIKEQESYPSQATLYETFPALMGKYRTAVLTMVSTLLPHQTLVQGDPQGWQSDLEAYLAEDADPRQVRFYVDPTGGKGKSWFQSYWYQKHPDLVQLLAPGKRDDLAHAIDSSRRYFFFNIPRGQLEFFRYEILEQLKDRVVFSPKYESQTKFLTRIPHVVVFTNDTVDEDKLSRDRYDIIVL